MEQTFEWNTGLYMVFVDLEKAFDSIDREVLCKILRHYGIPEKIVRMIRIFYEGFQARVLHEGEMTESFSMCTGVRQGCLLSPLLFLVAQDWVSRQAFGDNKTWIQFNLLQKLEDLDFVDDMVLLSQKITHMQHMQKCPRIFVLGHYLFRKAHSFPRATLLENCSLLGTDNILACSHAKWRLLFMYTTRKRCINYKAKIIAPIL